MHAASISRYDGDTTTIVQLLLEAGAKVEAAMIDGRRPLHYAAYADRVETTQLLLAAGADPNAADEDGHTPLHAAVREGICEVAQLLLKHCADQRLQEQDDAGCRRTAIVCTAD